MTVVTIRVTAVFERRYGKLPQSVKEKAKWCEDIFRNDPFNPQLRTHKLHGKHGKEWAFSVTQRCRIKFIFVNGNTVLFTDIGTHPEVYR